LQPQVPRFSDDSQRRLAQLKRWLGYTVAALSILLVLLFLDTAWHRLRYPYELEELEGAMFLFVRRVFLGGSVYVKPSLDFMPYMYPPAYYYAAAAMAHLTGMTMAALRLTSIVSTVGCFGMIYALVYREVRQHVPAMAAVGAYAGCYIVCQSWFDLGRLDSFFILTVLIAMYATRNWHPVIAALFWIVSMQAKQSVAPAAFLMLCCYGRDWKRTLPGLATFAVGAGAVFLWLNHATHGWYRFYVFQVPKANADIKIHSLVLFPFQGILQPFGLVVLVIAAAALWTRPSLQRLPTRFYLAACSLIPLFCWIAAHGGSTANVGMPIYALLAVLFGISLGRLFRLLGDVDLSFALPMTAMLLLVACVQLAMGIYNPGDVLMTSKGAQPRLNLVVASIRATPGTVFVTEHPYYAFLAGKEPTADLVSLHDSMRVAGATHAELMAETRAALEGDRYGTLFLDARGTKKIDGVLNDWTAWHSLFCSPAEVIPGAAALRPDWRMTLAGSSGCSRYGEPGSAGDSR
jgi:hypothetical protein